MLEARGETVDGSKVNANHDMLSEQGRRLAVRKSVPTWQSGLLSPCGKRKISN